MTTRASRVPPAPRVLLACGSATAIALATTLVTTSAANAAPADYEAENALVSNGVVESNHPGYSGSGFVNYDNETGGYVEWTVPSGAAGPTDLTFRFANGTAANRKMDITVDGTLVVDDHAFPGTGAWTNWQTTTVKANLSAGAKVRATAVTADGGPNVDKLTVAATDAEAPQAPPNLRSTGKTHNSVSLAWDAASDNLGVTGYDIYQHGQLEKSVGAVLATTVDGLDADTTYDWTVFAKDAAGNISPASNAVQVKTDPAPPDAQSPTVPGTLSSPGRTATTVDLAWGASTDNVKVTGYDIFRDGVQSGSADGAATTATVGGLTTGQSYKFRVRARDAAGNVSGFGNEITVTPAGGGPAGVPDPGTVTQIGGGTDIAWGLGFLPDGSAIITERETFNIYRLTESGTRTPLGKVPGAMGTTGEGGALGVEISPTFATDGFVYVYHTASGGNQLVRAKLTGNQLSGWTTLLGGVPKSKYHNGGRLRFSPDGKYLFISTGDAQNGSNAQNLNNNAGKILRIHPDGTIPADNPFPGKAIWSYGHRNVQGLDFDSKGRLWSSEFGNSSQDEVNLITKGGNYGWPGCEGTSGTCSGTIAPKKTWSTSSASPSGLTIINDHVFVATTVGQRVYRLRIDGNSNLVEQKAYFQGTYNRLRTVEVDRDGDIWLTTTTDKDGVAGNDRVLHIDIRYANGRTG
ncbi:PQQ-dependent sugar dehydrogenase [Amycolatopsis sp. YIM 10]|uniref:PQQ-dependent sugar dehydrogenase n=1 Tax=Amycolatopsis sp. YIM 10 TaxID=2653857 RepID=UPI00128FD7C9|nr:PQQ-dependent sugar dehydrogenase [Amycolatopsis sp. YIM 10]QFU88775.1 Chitinase A1 precursor [Amycolatopsis sp. YIM 10]